MNIRTLPPSANDGKQWCAWDYDNYDGADLHPNMGWGDTEAEAIADLKRILKEKKNGTV